MKNHNLFAIALLTTLMFTNSAHAAFWHYFQSAESVIQYINNNKQTLSVKDCESLAFQKTNSWRSGVTIMGMCHTVLREKSNSDVCLDAVERLANESGMVSREDYEVARYKCTCGFSLRFGETRMA